MEYHAAGAAPLNSFFVPKCYPLSWRQDPERSTSGANLVAGLTGDDSQILFLVTSLDTGRVSYQKFAVLGDAPQDDKVSDRKSTRLNSSHP